MSLLLCLAAAGAAAEPYEDGSQASAAELLAPELLRGPHHRVRDAVRSEGPVPVYTLESEFGVFEARGEDGVRARIREIDALVALRQAGERARAQSGSPQQGPYGTAWPVTSGGAAAPPLRDQPMQFADLDAMKREVAYRLGFDPYTDNEPLQQALQSHVWAVWNGGMRSPFLPSVAEAEAEREAPSERAAALVRDYPPEDLERLNRLELAAMGVDEAARERFLEHPAYSPDEATRLVDALAGLEATEDRAAFIAAAAAAPDADQAHRYERIAELMRRYQDETGDLRRFVAVDGRIAATTADGTLLVPVVADHAVWDAPVAAFAEAVARAAGGDPGVAKARVLVSGSLSERARQEMQGLGIDVREHALDAGDPPE